MRAEEFKTGNWLQSKQWGGQGQVEGIEIVDGGFDLKSKGHIHQYREGKYFDLEPIPLTPEILVRLGFERSGLYHFKNQVYIYDEYGFTTTGFEYRYNYTSQPIEYLHQLQNLYFALTGQELTYTP